MIVSDLAPVRPMLGLRRLALMTLGSFVLAGASAAQETSVAQALDADDLSPYSEVGLVADAAAIRPGQAFTVALTVSLDPGWHTYWLNGGDAGLPLAVQWTLPAGFAAGPLQWPAPKRIPLPPLMSYGYEDRLVLLAEITPPAGLRAGTTVELAAAADWLVCEEVCLPAMGEATLSLDVAGGAPVPHPSGTALIDEARQALPRLSEGWRTRAWPSEDGYILELAPPAAEDMPAPYFFVDEIGLVDHAAPQRVVREGSIVRMLVPRSEFADGPVPALRGIVVADAAADHGTAWVVELELEEGTEAGPGAEATAFLAPDVQLTGGLDGPAPAAAPDAFLGVGLWAALLFALLGGLALNLMPCVFPVLAVKVLGFVRQGGADPRHARAHGLAFGAGVLVSLWLLAAALLALRAAGAGLGWGFQLQSPLIVALLTLVVFALALNLAGVFEIGIGLTRLGAIGEGDSYRASFLTGGLAVVVATPCTAPFMGAALGYALVQPPLVGFAVFTALGLGLAAPYVALSAAPGLIRRLPRPGAWMVTFKQVLAFPMFATAVWLVWVFGRQLGVDASAVLLLALTVLGMAAWIAGRPSAHESRPLRLASWAAAGLALFVAFGAARAAAPVAPEDAAADLAWEPFSLERVAELRAAGRPVFVDFTAAWCLSCQVNERVAFRTDAVRTAFAEAEVGLLKADWTSRDPVIADVLRSFGRSGVPLYVLYPAASDRQPELLPTLLTPGMVVDGVARAAATAD